MNLPENGRYEGYFVDNLIHGEGTLILPDGSKYVGEFKYDRYHGYGKYYDSDGVVLFHGQWENGKFVD